MQLELSKMTINLKTKITWKEIIWYEKALKDSLYTDESFTVLLFFIDNIISDVKYEDKVITWKFQIEDLILNPEITTLEDLNKINSEVWNYIKKKIS